jgi:hypothetical protein
MEMGILTDDSNFENDLAEKCRLALEKSWGDLIPRPNQCKKIQEKSYNTLKQ